MPRSLPAENVLLCSSPRSGSTFAANLVRSSPDVAFLNEIMTRGRYLLPRFVESREASADGETLKGCYEDEVERLFAYTLPYGRNLLHRSRTIKAAVFGILKAASSATARIGLEGFDRNPFYRFYYLNGLHEPFFRPFFESQFPKHGNCRVLLTKEVHLLRSYQSFRAMYPEGKVIYLIRDPHRQVASERKNHGYMEPDTEKKRVGEPSEEQQRRKSGGIDRMVATYGQEQLIRRHYGKSFEQMFSLFWRLDNDALVELMETEPDSRFLPLRYEDLVADTRSTVEKMLEFIGLEHSANLERYLKVLADFQGSQRHGRSTFVGQNSIGRRPVSEDDKEREERVNSVINGSIAATRFRYG
jgi:hypothetical protein